MKNIFISLGTYTDIRQNAKLVLLSDVVCASRDENLNPFARDSQYRNRWNAPGVGWLVCDVVFLDLLNLAGAPRDAHGCRIQEHHRYVFRDAGNACHRACKHKIYRSLSDNIFALRDAESQNRYHYPFD